ncbi:MAG: peptidylprolyl isomerase, partial [Halocynthiibacter sp.]
YRSPTLYEPAHILFAADPRDEDARRLAEKRATVALGILARRPDDFDRLARDQSDCPSRDTGGRMGQIGPGDTVPEFEAALDQMAEGETNAAPVPTRYGLHIIRLISRAEGTPLPFAAVRATIGEALEKAAWARAAQGFVTSLVDKADITGVDMSASLNGK